MPVTTPTTSTVSLTSYAPQLLAETFAAVRTVEQAIAANDKEMHNRNWMKAPASFKVANGTEARQSEKPMRYVLGMFTLTQGEHWFRMKNVRDDGDMSTQGQHDYFEIVPKSVISDPTKPEDRY